MTFRDRVTSSDLYPSTFRDADGNQWRRTACGPVRIDTQDPEGSYRCCACRDLVFEDDEDDATEHIAALGTCAKKQCIGTRTMDLLLREEGMKRIYHAIRKRDTDGLAKEFTAINLAGAVNGW